MFTVLRSAGRRVNQAPFPITMMVISNGNEPRFVHSRPTLTSSSKEGRRKGKEEREARGGGGICKRRRSETILKGINVFIRGKEGKRALEIENGRFLFTWNPKGNELGSGERVCRRQRRRHKQIGQSFAFDGWKTPKWSYSCFLLGK